MAKPPKVDQQTPAPAGTAVQKQEPPPVQPMLPQEPQAVPIWISRATEIHRLRQEFVLRLAAIRTANVDVRSMHERVGHLEDALVALLDLLGAP